LYASLQESIRDKKEAAFLFSDYKSGKRSLNKYAA
jgi:hypothetical protein